MYTVTPTTQQHEDTTLEGVKETHSSILAWRTPWTEEPGGLQSIWSRRVGRDQSDLACRHASTFAVA